MSDWRDYPPLIPPKNIVREPSELEQFKAKWTWVGWQTLKWTPVVLLTLAISESSGPASSAAFLGLVLLIAWAYSRGKMVDLLYWATVVILLTIIAVLTFGIWDSARSAIVNFWPELVGSLFLPMIFTLAGRKNPRLMKPAVIASLAVIAVGLYQINSAVTRHAASLSTPFR